MSAAFGIDPEPPPRAAPTRPRAPHGPAVSPGAAVAATDLLVVTGHPRSGTTILRRVLSTHPAIALTNELQCFVGVGLPVHPHHFGRVLRRGLRRRSRESVFAVGGRSGGWAHNARCTARFAMALAGRWGRPLDLATLERGYRRIYPAARWVGDKSPTYVFDLEPLLAGGVTCAVIYRDCRDVVTSTLEAAHGAWRGLPHTAHVDTAAKVARRWVRAIDAMERRADRVIALRYEDMVGQPEATLSVLATRLGIDPGGIDPRAVRAGRVGRHRLELSAADRAAVEEIAGPTLRRLGYT